MNIDKVMLSHIKEGYPKKKFTGGNLTITREEFDWLIEKLEAYIEFYESSKELVSVHNWGIELK